MADQTQIKLATKGAPSKRPGAASIYLKTQWGIEHTPSTLATKRSRGGGPRFFKAGPAILYSDDALDEYAQAYLGEAVASTSELRPPRGTCGKAHQLTREAAAP